MIRLAESDYSLKIIAVSAAYSGNESSDAPLERGVA